MKRIVAYILFLLISVSAYAQTDTIRYVLTKEHGGAYRNNGLSWATAKDNVQDAINDLKDYMNRHHLTSGCVYVGAGVYTPTESTEANRDGILYTSFKIPEGISVYGGFAPDGKIYQPTGAGVTRTTEKTIGAWQTSPDDRLMTNGATQGENNNNTVRHRIPDDKKRGWDFDEKSKTYLSGNHASHTTTTGYLTWNSNRQMYDEAFPGNSYHVVWFAMNGLLAADNENTQGHYAPLNRQALLDGFVVCGGNASTQALDARVHTAYGGGIYMVEGAVVRNCRIQDNAAARKGGGIYMDGGGIVETCFIQRNQAKGIGLTDGYGGGIALDHNGQIRHCVLVDNAASIGGGMVIEHERSTYPDCNPAKEGQPAGANFVNSFTPSASGTVIANNTATTEGGGLAMMSGGTVNHLTIVRNHCSGNLVTLNSRRYGRSGGLFIDIGGIMFNSVVWGNTTANNGMVQYAAYIPNVHDAGEGVQPYITFTAISNHDEAEWTGTYKQGVYPLNSENNRPAAGRHLAGYYPEFGKVPDLKNGIAGVESTGQENVTDWIPSHVSDLVAKGLHLRDYVTTRAQYMLNAAMDRDVYGNQLAPVSTLGAYMSTNVIDNITPATDVAAIDAANGKTVKTLFVDPAYKATQGNSANRGNSWDNPLVFLSDALHWVDDQYQDNDEDPNHVIYQILVKEGDVTAADRQANVHAADAEAANYSRLRDLSTTMTNGVRLYGGFYGELENTTIKDASNKYARDPMRTPTVISGNVSGLTYTDNVAHVVTLDNVSNVIFDGFKLYGGNTRTNNEGTGGLHDPWIPAIADGAGILIRGGANNTIRNCYIANCRAQDGQGGAIYASGSTGLQLENLVIHNNAAYPTGNAKPAAVFITGGGTATMNHCLLRGNVGAVTSDGAGTIVTVTNTAFHANGTTDLDGVNVESGQDLINDGQSGDKLLALTLSNGGAAGTCDANMMDDDLGRAGAANRVTTEGFTAKFNHNPNNNNTYPTFANPTTSIGVSESGLVTFYGGTPDFTPANMNPMVNAANDDPTPATVGNDISTQTPRNQGGAPDIGPIENTDLPAYGTVLYVTPNGAGKKDGTSWNNAIAGNTIYDNNNTNPANARITSGGTDVQTTDAQYAGFYNATTRPYGETSNTSKNFWETNSRKARSTYPTMEVGKSYYLVNFQGGKPLGAIDGNTTAISATGGYIFECISADDGDYVYLRRTDNNQYLAAATNSNWNTTYVTNTSNYTKWRVTNGMLSSYQNTEAYLGINQNEGEANNVPVYYDKGGGNYSIWKFVEVNGNYAESLAAFNEIYGTQSEIILATITNNREERYVSGLQYAVERASADAKTDSTPKQVWVAAGVYTDWKGFVIRDLVEVYGGFPNNGTPGMDERHPLLSDYIPKRHEDNNLTPSDYETILQPQANSPVEWDNYNQGRIVASNIANDVVRKPVLAQPDICMTTCAPGDANSDTDRRNDALYKMQEYKGALWDGFTVRHGYYNGYTANRDGGAGVRIFENVTIQNFVVKDNVNIAGLSTNGQKYRSRGGGIYCDGKNSKVLNSFIINNYNKGNEAYGGGMYMIVGTCYNLCVANNHAEEWGGGIFVEDASLYNNTIAYNRSNSRAGLAQYTGTTDNSTLLLYNNIFYGNVGTSAVGTTNADYFNGINYSYVHGVVETALINTNKIKNTEYGTALDNPFEAGENAQANNDFRLSKDAALCRNKGTENILSTTGDNVELPLTDVDFTNRIKDCAVDIGAYEFNGATDIEPQVKVEDGITKHVYYVTETGNGVASANSPANAACAGKLQLVLDAAGRHKWDLLNDADATNDNIEIVVRLAGFGEIHSDMTSTGYAPTHEVEFDDYGSSLRPNTSENPLMFSLAVPRGITLEGGWCLAHEEEIPDVVVTSVRITNASSLNFDMSTTDVSAQLIAQLSPLSANDSETITWTSSDENVVTVDGNGNVNAVGAGTATIYATCQGKYALCQVTVVNPLIGITLDKTTATIGVGKTLDLYATLQPENPSGSTTITWRTDDDAIATVENGVVTAVAEGTTTITATCQGKEATCEVKVVNYSLDKSHIDLSVTNNVADATATLTVTGGTGTVGWSSSNTSVATVNTTGTTVTVTPVGYGITTITATSGSNSAKCVVVVTEKWSGNALISNGSRPLYASGTISVALRNANYDIEANITDIAIFKNYLWEEGGTGTTITLRNVGQNRYINIPTTNNGTITLGNSANLKKGTGTTNYPNEYYVNSTTGYYYYYYLRDNNGTLSAARTNSASTNYGWTFKTITKEWKPSDTDINTALNNAGLSAAPAKRSVEESSPNRNMTETSPQDEVESEQADTEETQAPSMRKAPQTVQLEDFAERDPLKYQTVLTGHYSIGKQQANVYHVLTFTEAVYDENHDIIADKSLSNVKYGRTIVDGCFITGGQAVGTDNTGRAISTDGKTGFQIIDAYYNPGNYGGAAIVPSYAHIRNCVIEYNNSAAGGGALMLKPRALVSGCIIRNNTTDGNGGAIYVLEPTGARVGQVTITDDNIPLHEEGAFDPTTDINRPAVAGGEYRYSNIFTSTIVHNEAVTGGGVYFSTNLRMNSTVLWRNSANSNANISGELMPAVGDKELAPWEYPLQYCAVENNRVQGYNNISIASDASKGARWNFNGDDATLKEEERFFYDLKKYSLLTRNGMLMVDYNTLIDGFDDNGTHYAYFPSLSKYDIAGKMRTEHTANNYIEIGARVFDEDVMSNVDTAHIMTRMFVALPEDVNLENAEILQNNNLSDEWQHNYYAQVGSTMAYPFNRLDDALEYVQRVRKMAFEFNQEDSSVKEKGTAKKIANTRFEIFVANGTHYPYRTIKGAYSNTRGNTFLIPEGVAIYGGISADADTLSNLGYMGANDADLQVSDGTNHITLRKAITADVLASRARHDINQNGIIEGWGFKDQTVLSGDVVNSDNSKNVFHIVSIIAAEEYVGLLPDATTTNSDEWKGTTFKERGCPIILDGLQITGGEAIGYDPAVQSTSTYYKGGAICVDGNWVTGTFSNETGEYVDNHKETTLSYYDPDEASHAGDRAGFDMAKRSVGYRDIPLIVRNCYITNNKAGMGGAIFTNGTLQMYSSQLAQNTAQMNKDHLVEIINVDENNNNNTVTKDVTIYGRGGAIQSTYLTILMNCVFANNSALSDNTGTGLSETYYVDKNGVVHKDKKYNIPNGTGGAICVGENAILQMMNCDVVRNKADAYPAIYAFAPNAGYTDLAHLDLSANAHAILNSVFWGNQSILLGSGAGQQQHYEYLMNPVSSYRYEGPKNYYEDANYMGYPEALWFCAYEPGAWYEPRVLKTGYSDNAKDVRRMPYNFENSSQQVYVPQILRTQYAATDSIDRYNFNILINFDNSKSDGPNFINPSNTAGAEGYTPSADWMMSRMNNLVDWGWTFMNQHVEPGETQFIEVDGKKGCGPYYEMAQYINTNPTYDGVIALPVEEQTYMLYATDGKPMHRVSKDPNPSHQQTYIDIGAYEYPHIELTINTTEDAVDVLWVSSKERQDVGAIDGSTWERATSDLQRAIETLLASRNDHRKEIRILDGEYMPRYTISGNRAFVINTGYQDANSTVAKEDIGETPPVSDAGYGVRSLTIRGGYSADIKGQYDPETYPAVVTMYSSDSENSQFISHTFIVEDARQRVKMQTSGGGSTALNSVIPITLEGISFANTEASKDANAGGSAVYYKAQMDGENPLGVPATTAGNSEPYTYTPTGELKLTIKNCVFLNNSQNVDITGKESFQPAVKIEQGGGEALIFNSLWHHNRGNSLEAVNTKVINCTFGLNDGKVVLSDLTENGNAYTSELHNSILWRNGANKTAATDGACEETNELEKTGGDQTAMTYNAIMGHAQVEDDHEHNSSLSIDNNNVMTGPNFVDPEAGDFSVLPSVRITSKASSVVYLKHVAGEDYTTEEDAKTALLEHISADSLLYTEGNFEKAHSGGYLKYHDLANFVRLFDDGLERGAYESQAKQNRVIYLIPNKSTQGTGDSWGQAYAGSQLQTAINAAAVYTQSHGGATSYLFSKGNNATNMGNILLRNGVHMYGTIQLQFMDEAALDEHNNYTDEAIAEYITKVLNDEQRSVAATATERTVISGITTGQTVTSVLDGFEITPMDADVEQNTPAITVGEDAGAVVIRNSIIHDYKMADDVPLADLQGHTLLYNSLVRDNNAPVHLGNQAYIENCTMVSDVEGLTSNLTYGEGATANTHFLNSIDFCGNVVSSSILATSPFAPYFHKKNTYYNGDLDESFTKNKNLWYQLHEMSEYLEKVDVKNHHFSYEGNKETDIRLPENLRYYVNYRADRDLLGNPRVINFGSTGPISDNATGPMDNVFVDYGCYETWSTGNPNEGIGSGPDNSILFPSRNKKYYGGNYYPHEGSVVYINQDGKVVLDDAEDGKFTQNNPFRPGYLLVREGGSLFGQGSTVQLSYVAVQRNLTKRYGLMSLPFPLRKSLGKTFPTMYTTVAHIIYDKEGGGIGVVGKAFSNTGERPDGLPEEYFDPIPLKGYYYNGNKRKEWNYKYVNTDSPCWEAIPDNTTIPANKGWLIDLGSTAAEGEKERIIRFTGYGNSVLDFIYTEGQTVDNQENYNSKTIDLIQYDDRTSTDNGADFTDEYNMGWNLVGIPYLVSAYRTGREITEGEEGYGTHTYAMSAPRILYALDNNSNYKTFQSWENTAGTDLTVVQGFFTQTATLQDKEKLHFVVPKYEAPVATSPAGIVAFRRGNNTEEDDVVELHPAENGSLTYSLGSDGAKFMAMDNNLAQIYAVGTSSLRMSLLSSAPIDREIPLGLRIPESDIYTFSLPDPEAFEQSYDTLSVWLIDKRNQRVVNLMEDDYPVYLQQEEENIGRFYITFSHKAPEQTLLDDEAYYTVIAHDNTLTVKGLRQGDHIVVFSVNGMKVADAYANDESWSTFIMQKSMYVVRINNYVTKALAP